MAVVNGLKVVGYFDCPGAGQVVVRDRVANVGHIAPPNGTSTIEVGDPSAPRNRVQSNDVCYDDRGPIHLIDRTRGLHILERNQVARTPAPL